MRRLILTHKRLLDVPDGLNHAEFVQQGGRSRLRLQDHCNVVQVHREALLDQDDEEVEAAAQAALGLPVRVGWYS